MDISSCTTHASRAISSSDIMMMSSCYDPRFARPAWLDLIRSFWFFFFKSNFKIWKLKKKKFYSFYFMFFFLFFFFVIFNIRRKKKLAFTSKRKKKFKFLIFKKKKKFVGYIFLLYLHEPRSSQAFELLS